MKKLAIIGAGDFQFPLVKKAKLMGIETHCFAWLEGAVCKEISDYFYPISILNKEQILEICQQVKIDGIVSIASDAAVTTVSYISEKMNLVGNAYSDALAATNKYLMRERFLQNGVASPKYALASDDLDLSTFHFPAIVKPVDRSGSRGIRKILKEKEVWPAVEVAQKKSFTKQAIIEEYIEGAEVSVEAISWKGTHHILCITDKVTTEDPYFVEIEHHQPSLINSEVQEKIKSETLKLLNTLNINYGASHSEFRVTESGRVFAIEVGARMGGDFIGSDLICLSTGYDYVKGVIEIALGEFHTPVFSQNKVSGVYFLSEETSHLLTTIKKSRNIKEIVKAEITNSKLNLLQSSADRSGYLIYQSEKRFAL